MRLWKQPHGATRQVRSSCWSDVRNLCKRRRIHAPTGTSAVGRTDAFAEWPGNGRTWRKASVRPTSVFWSTPGVHSVIGRGILAPVGSPMSDLAPHFDPDAFNYSHGDPIGDRAAARLDSGPRRRRSAPAPVVGAGRGRGSRGPFRFVLLGRAAGKAWPDPPSSLPHTGPARTAGRAPLFVRPCRPGGRRGGALYPASA